MAWPNPRFTDNGTGTVTDNLTRLIWLRNASCTVSTRDWATALADVVSLNNTGTMNGNNCADTSNSGGHQTDWRMPNVLEMQSLIHYGLYYPAVPNTAGTGQWVEGDPFTGVRSDWYWSSTSSPVSSSSRVWLVHLGPGYVGGPGFVDPIIGYVWPVRGGS